MLKVIPQRGVLHELVVSIAPSRCGKITGFIAAVAAVAGLNRTSEVLKGPPDVEGGHARGESQSDL